MATAIRIAGRTTIAFPSTRPPSPCANATITIVTTAAPYQPDRGPQGPGAPYNSAAKFYAVYSGDTTGEHDLRISHVAIDRKHTSMEDAGCWFPLAALRDAHAAGRIGRIARRFHGAPTNRSQRHTLEVDAPGILSRCRDDGVDAAILVPNCPVCHQTLSLVARHLEQHGIATVIMGCARDIVEHCGVPRFLFSDFPLGNSAGKPHDAESQRFTLALALDLLEHAPAAHETPPPGNRGGNPDVPACGARTTVQSPLAWSDSPDWKLDYCNAARLTPEELARLRAENERAKAIARDIRQQTIAPQREQVAPTRRVHR